MYITKNGTTSTLTQYQCSNLPQVKSIINDLTTTNSTNKDWKEICKFVKKNGGSDSIDYFCFLNDKENDCSVHIGYDNNTNSFYVSVEI